MSAGSDRPEASEHGGAAAESPAGWWAAGGLAVTLAVLLAWFPLLDYDTWWHLRTGQLIWERGAVPTTDWFTFTSENEPWIDIHWGFQLLVAGAYAAGGVPGLIVLRMTVAGLIAAVGVAATRQLLPSGWRRPGLALLVWVPALLLMSNRFYVRPELVTLLLFALFLTLLLTSEQFPGRLWLLPIVQAVWANVQGLFVFGPIMVAFYGLEVWRRRAQLPADYLRRYGWMALLVAGACLISPYGWRNVSLTLVYWRKISQPDNIYKQTIQEFVTLPKHVMEGGWVTPYTWLQVGLLAAGAVLIGRGGWRAWRDGRCFCMLAWIAFATLAWTAVRNSNQFALVSAFVLPLGFSQSFASPRPPLGRRLDRLGWVMAGMALFALVSGLWHLGLGGTRFFSLAPRPGQYALAECRLAGQPGMPTRAFVSHLGQAGVYVAFNGPERRLFMDGRLEVPTEATYRRYLEIEKRLLRDPDGPDPLAAEGVGLILADHTHNSALAAALWASTRWQCVACGPVASVFTRRTERLPAGVAAVPLAQLAVADVPSVASVPPLADRPATLHRPLSAFLPTPAMADDETDAHAEGLYRLTVQSLNRPLADPGLPLALACWGLRQAERSCQRRPWTEGPHLWRGSAWSTVGTLLSAGKTSSSEWHPVIDLPRAFAAAALRDSLACDPRESGAQVLWAECFRQAGALDRFVDQITLVSPKSLWTAAAERARLQQSVAPFAAPLDQARKQAAANPTPSPERWRMLWDLGLLGTAAAEAQANPAAGDPDLVGRMLLLIGEADTAAAWYSGPGRSLGPLADLRLAQARHALGQYAAAETAYRVLLADPANAREAHLGLAWLALQRGDRPALRQHLAALHSAPWATSLALLFRLAESG